MSNSVKALEGRLNFSGWGDGGGAGGGGGGGWGGWVVGGDFEACACISFTVGRFFTNGDRFTSHWVPLRRIGSLLSPNVFSHLIGFFYTSLGHFSPNYIRLFPDSVLFGAIWCLYRAEESPL